MQPHKDPYAVLLPLVALEICCNLRCLLDLLLELKRRAVLLLSSKPLQALGKRKLHPIDDLEQGQICVRHLVADEMARPIAVAVDDGAQVAEEFGDALGADAGCFPQRLGLLIFVGSGNGDGVVLSEASARGGNVINTEGRKIKRERRAWQLTESAISLFRSRILRVSSFLRDNCQYTAALPSCMPKSHTHSTCRTADPHSGQARLQCRARCWASGSAVSPRAAAWAVPAYEARRDPSSQPSCIA